MNEDETQIKVNEQQRQDIRVWPIGLHHLSETEEVVPSQMASLADNGLSFGECLATTAGEFVIFSVSAKASLPISLSPISLPLSFPSHSSPFDLSFAL